MKPSRAAALTTARPGPTSMASSSVAVLSFAAVCATVCRTASTEPSERSSVATCLPACWPTISSPTRRAKEGSPVIFTPAPRSALASSWEIQLSRFSRYAASRLLAACPRSSATAASPPWPRTSFSATLLIEQEICRSPSSCACVSAASRVHAGAIGEKRARLERSPVSCSARSPSWPGESGRAASVCRC